LGKIRIRTELQNNFRKVFEDKEITVEDVNGEEVKARPKIDLDAIASDRLRQGIAEGTLKEVKLIDTSAIAADFDAPDPVKIRRREMALKVEVPFGQQVAEVLEAIKPWAREQGFNEMYVQWVPAAALDDEDERGVANEPQKAKINLAQDDIGETLYARKEFVELANPHGDLSTEISEEMIGGMLRMLD
jgi:hypothetical protein